MDLNYLYHRQQVSQFNADNSGSEPSRRAHQEIADTYRTLISSAKNAPRPEARA
jgi:hypothetical protein